MFATRAAALLVILLATGCGGLVAFKVDSEPRGAKVYLDNEELVGVTPTELIYRRTTEPSVPVTIELLNYKPLTFLVPSQVTYETEEEAEARAPDYRFILQPR